METIIEHIKGKFALQYRLDEDALHGREPAGDPLTAGRPHQLYDVALYFIPPHRFKAADLEYIKKLAEWVSVVPVCAKADAMTTGERNRLQGQIRDDINGCTWLLLCPASMQLLERSRWKPSPAANATAWPFFILLCLPLQRRWPHTARDDSVMDP